MLPRETSMSCYTDMSCYPGVRLCWICCVTQGYGYVSLQRDAKKSVGFSGGWHDWGGWGQPTQCSHTEGKSIIIKGHSLRNYSLQPTTNAKKTQKPVPPINGQHAKKERQKPETKTMFAAQHWNLHLKLKQCLQLGTGTYT